MLNIKKFPKFTAALLVAAVCYSPAAFADKGGKGHGHGHGKHDDRDDDRNHGHNSDRVYIHDNDRIIIKKYVVNDYRSHCPPGLAKKHNGCLPPGQAKKLYIIGQPLPEYVEWEPVPQPLLIQLQPVPAGYQYVQVDKDILLISAASHHVIDAITLLSAVGH